MRLKSPARRSGNCRLSRGHVVYFAVNGPSSVRCRHAAEPHAAGPLNGKSNAMQELPLRTITLAIVVTTFTCACATSGANRNSAADGGGGVPPQLWSDHKLLAVPVGVCADRAFNVLNALGYSNVVKNGNYSYGDFNENRAAVKCVEGAGGSFVYFAVAGSQRETVERLRNQIAQKL